MRFPLRYLPSTDWLSELRRQAPVIIPILIATVAVLAPEIAAAQEPPPSTSPGAGVAGGDYRICEMTARLFELIEGNFGSLVMVLGGILAVVSAAFGAYRSAVSLLVIAVGSFILRSMVDIFFNYGQCTGGGTAPPPLPGL